MTVCLPDDNQQHLRALAQSRCTTLNRLIDDIASMMLAEINTETRFKLSAARGAGNQQRALALLDKFQAQR